MKTKDIHFFEICFIIYITWFFLPISKGYFFGGIYNVIFFVFYILAMVHLVLLNLKTNFDKISFGVVFPILIYMVVMSLMCLIDLKDANKHIRVSFTFWGTLLYYFLLDEFPDSKRRIVKYVFFLTIVTYVTTLIGITIDNSAARTISYAGANGEISNSLLKRNISGVYFIQMSIMFVPLAFYVFVNSKKRIKFFAFAFLVVEFYFVLRASFTISLAIYVLAIMLSFFFFVGKRNSDMLLKIIGICTAGLLLISIDWASIFKWLSDNIENTFISNRMEDMYNLLIGGKKTGDAGLRMDLYVSSLKTFSENLFGIGPNYSYIKFDEGIGHHSQMLDDFARYGIFGIMFYLVYIKNYYRLIKSRYSQSNCGDVAAPMIALYFIFLLLNLSFRSSDESVVMFLVLPEIMEIMNIGRYVGR